MAAWQRSPVTAWRRGRKTEYMIIGSRQKFSQIINEPVLSIGSESVSRVSSTKTLGVIVDERFTLRIQIDQVQRKPQKELTC